MFVAVVGFCHEFNLFVVHITRPNCGFDENIHKFRIITYYTEFAVTSECAIQMNSLPQSHIQYQLFPILHFANGTYFSFGRFSTNFAWNSKASIWTYTYYIVMWYSFKLFLESNLKSIGFLSKKSISKEFSIDFFSTLSTHSQNDAFFLYAIPQIGISW